MQQNHITAIAGMNVKGRNFRHELDPLTILVGGNTAGKTAITDAIQIALLGYHPALGKKASATMLLAPESARQMEVEATHLTGSIRRTFTRTKTGASAETVGTAPDLLPAQLHFADFLNAKPTERHATLNSLMAAIDYTALGERLKAKMAALGLMDKVTVTINPQGEKPLDAAIQALADEAKGIKQSVDIARKTLATLTATEIPANQASADKIAAAEQAVAKAVEAVGRAGQTVDQLSERLQRAPDEPEADPPSPEDLQIARDAVEAARTELANADAANRHAHTLGQQIAEAEQAANKLEAAASHKRGDAAPTETLAELQGNRTHCQQAIALLDAEILELSRDSGANEKECQTLEGQIGSLREHGTCPCCGTTGQALEAAMEAMLARKQAARQTATDCRNRIATMKAEKDTLTGRLAEIAATEQQITAWQSATELEAAKAKLATLREQRKETDITAAKRAFAEAEQRLAALTRADDEWKAYRAAKIPTAAEIEAAAQAFQAAKATRETVVAELEAMREQRAAYDRAIADQQRIAELTAQADEMEATAKGIAELRAWLQQEQRDATAAAMRPLTTVAGCFLNGIVNGELAVEQHLVGIRRGDAFLPLEVLSGMEMLAVSAACQAAIASAGALKLLIVDEMARMTPRNRAQFAANCAGAIEAGVISQAILIDQTATEYPEGKVIACG